jgi:hypothetical protein
MSTAAINAGAISSDTLAEARVVRTIAIVLGAAVAVYAVVSLGTIIEQAHYVDPVWSTVIALALFTVPPALAFASGRLSLRTTRVVLGVYALVFLAVVAGWIPAMHNATMPLATPPWPLGLTSIGTVPAALAWRPVWAWLTVAANGALLGVVRYFASGGIDAYEALQDGLFAVAFSSIFTVVAIVAIRNARSLDQAARSARTSAAGAAATAARLHEQARLDALIHDELMTALYYATNDSADLAGSVRAQASRALDELASLDADPGDEPPVTPQEFASRLRSVLLDLSSGLQITTDLRREATLPGAVADAFAEGATEALRNSLRHAGGPEVVRSAIIRLTTFGATVIVRDNGAGFDPAAVDPYRLGILVSIRGRLNAVDRGSAHVSSAPGRGTTITLDWRDS